MNTRAVISKKNPIISKQGVCDPHIHVFDGKLYLYASHDFSRDNKNFCMKDWQIWSSKDAILWELESVVRPEDFYMGSSNDCWATDAAYKNGKYYFYFSNRNKQTGVAVSDKPGKGFKDALGRPLLDGTLTTTREYDPAVFTDDDGCSYIVFGSPVWAHGEGAGYFIAKLGDDMVTLDEKPRRLEVDHECDDKASLNKIGGTYYLTWASFYAISDHVYGPYKLMGNTGASVDHGSYFEWHNQLFNAFTVLDPTKHFRGTGICYVHQKKNKELVVDPVIVEYGVGQYDGNWNKIEAEWYMQSTGITKEENLRFGFDVCLENEKGSVIYPNIRNLDGKGEIAIYAACECIEGATVEIYDGSENGQLLGVCQIKNTTDTLRWRSYRLSTCKVNLVNDKMDICLVIKKSGEGQVRIDFFRFDD